MVVFLILKSFFSPAFTERFLLFEKDLSFWMMTASDGTFLLQLWYPWFFAELIKGGVVLMPLIDSA